ncbi:hypothetical protein DRJ04_05890 [Candidatus Aerophobetes bacterium]|uniref:Amidohydrolase-related domain-containing protein n=1 Tax=Aerophobetes bacterium TaxID=2030807 RepID=A0A662DEP4_UNCAE|nr:MAG: hypothetical protein DRJ04_05890 [Candidatus Aerophobetes bacterium]
MSRKVILRNCNIVDVVNQRVLERQSILIDGAQIKKIGQVEELTPLEKELPKESIFELEGREVIPGLIDSHLHLCVVPGLLGSCESDAVLETLRASETLKVLSGAKNAKETLEAGFTTVRDVGQGDNLALRDAIERGFISGPRIVACGWLGVTGGHQEELSPEGIYNVQLRKEDIGVDGPWEIRKKVRELVRKGVDCIKTFVSGGGYIRYPWDHFWSSRESFTDEELKALVDEAHSAGRRVAAHATVSSAIKSAIAAGVDTIEHGLFLDEEDINEMRKKGIFYVPTLTVFKEMWNVDRMEGRKFLPVEKERAKRYLETHLSSFRKAYECGVKIAMGSDTFKVLKHGNNAQELEWMVKAGMSEMEALVSATKTASEALGVDSMVGSIEEGKLADLLVVDRSPLTDISVLRDKRNLKMIMKNGEIICSRL